MHFGKCHLSCSLNTDCLPAVDQSLLKGNWSIVLPLQTQPLKLLEQNICLLPTDSAYSYTESFVLATLSQSLNKGHERRQTVIGQQSVMSHGQVMVRIPEKKCQNLKKNRIYGTVSTQLPLQITINFKMFTHSPPTTLPQPMVNASHSWILMRTLFLWRTEAVLETKHSLRGW